MLDPMNRQAVGVRGDEVVVIAPRQSMTRDEALVHAAWLVTLADPDGDRFAEALAAVQAT